MGILTIKHKKSVLMPTIPHKILINNILVGTMQGTEASLEIPEGEYRVTIQSMIPFFSASQWINVQSGVRNMLTFRDREKWWDLLLYLDLGMWFADLFFTLPSPWNTVYSIFTNGYFAVWIAYEFIIRKKYFRLEFSTYKL